MLTYVGYLLVLTMTRALLLGLFAALHAMGGTGSHPERNEAGCLCGMQIPLPLDGQVWLLRHVTMMAALHNCNGSDELAPFLGHLAFNIWFTPRTEHGSGVVTTAVAPDGSTSTVGESLVAQDSVEMTPDHHGEIEFTFLERHIGHFRVEVGQRWHRPFWHPLLGSARVPHSGPVHHHVSPSQVIGSNPPGFPECAGVPPWNKTVEFQLRPYTHSDPRDVITADALEARVAVAAPATAVPASPPPQGRGAQTSARFAFASLMYGSSDYLPGVLVLAASLRAVEARHPLVVLVAADEVGPHAVAALEAAGCLVERASIPSLGRAAGGSGSDGDGSSGGGGYDNGDGAKLVGPGAALEELGDGVWLKLHLWRMAAYDKVI